MNTHIHETTTSFADNDTEDVEIDFTSFSYATNSDPFLKRFIIRSIEKSTGQLKIWKLYKKYKEEERDPEESFWEAALRKLEISLDFNESKLQEIPKSGPLVIVANHPFGVLDGLILCYILHRVRPDFKVLTNSVLTRSPEVEKHLLPVDFSPTKQAREQNLATRQAARETLERGGCLGVFPAGGVATIPNLGANKAQDLPWQPFIGQLIRRSEATVVPISFEGQNSRLFQIVSRISMTLRLSLFFRELCQQIGDRVRFTIGTPVPYQDLQEFKDPAKLINHLDEVTHSLPQRAK